MALFEAWTPKERQAEFLWHVKYNPWVRYLWYVGGFGSGKSLTLCEAGLELSRMFPGNRGLLARNTYEDLKNTTMKTFFESVPSDLILDYNKVDKRVLIDTGAEPSEILFGGLDDIERLKSLELGWFGIDEVDEVAETTFVVLTGRLRRQQAKKRMGMIASNSEGKNWTWRRFVEEARKQYIWMRASSYENIEHLPEGYIDEMIANFPPDMIERYIFGGFNVFQGMIYPEFNRELHVYKDRPMPRNWEFAAALDNGMANPNAWGFYYVDYEGNIFLHREKYDTGKIVSDHAKEIENLLTLDEWQRFTSPSFFTIADTSVNTKDPITGRTIAEEYSDHNIFFDLANKDVMGGINRVREYLRYDPTHKHPFTGEMGAPRFFINEKCVNAIREYQTYKWKPQTARDNELNLQEQPLKKFDHSPDRDRYFIMSRPRAPKRQIKAERRAVTMEERVRIQDALRAKAAKLAKNITPPKKFI